MKSPFSEYHGTSRADDTTRRLHQFEETLREASWRIQLLKKMGIGASPFINILLASPYTLLVLCIRYRTASNHFGLSSRCKDWSSCRAVIQFFQMGKEMVDLTNRAEDYSNLLDTVRSTSNGRKAIHYLRIYLICSVCSGSCSSKRKNKRERQITDVPQSSYGIWTSWISFQCILDGALQLTR